MFSIWRCENLHYRIVYISLSGFIILWSSPTLSIRKGRKYMTENNFIWLKPSLLYSFLLLKIRLGYEGYQVILLLCAKSYHFMLVPRVSNVRWLLAPPSFRHIKHCFDPLVDISIWSVGWNFGVENNKNVYDVRVLTWKWIF